MTGDLRGNLRSLGEQMRRTTKPLNKKFVSLQVMPSIHVCPLPPSWVALLSRASLGCAFTGASCPMWVRLEKRNSRGERGGRESDRERYRERGERERDGERDGERNSSGRIAVGKSQARAPLSSVGLGLTIAKIFIVDSL